VYHSRDAALKLAFPDADRTEARDFFLTAVQRERIEAAAKSRIESDLLTVYVGHRGGEVVGFAILDTHVVRTLPETFMIVLAPDGTIRATHVLAFYEPTDYLPSERWLAQFTGKSEADDLRLGRGIDGITGSTLSARAVSDAIRRALALHAVLLEGR
jgi:Na+-translocating ferredoxin:NAD+ oxidoreductase RnfG subunit